MSEVVLRWQRGWGAARALPAAEDVGGGLRLVCRQPGREVEYVATGGLASLAGLAERVAAERAVTWLTVPTAEPEAAAPALESLGLIVLKRTEMMMTISLRDQPASVVTGPYHVVTEVGEAVVTVTVRHESGEAGARGTMGIVGADAIADRIETMPAHRRKGLASAVMSALAGAALARGAGHGILVASEEGRHLYAKLGWRPVAHVLIAAMPGTTYPS